MSETTRNNCTIPNCTICLDGRMMDAFKAKGLPADEWAWLKDLWNRMAHECMGNDWTHSELRARERDLTAGRAETEELKARIREIDARPAVTPREDARGRVVCAIDKALRGNTERVELVAYGGAPTAAFDIIDFAERLAAEFPDAPAPQVTREKVREAFKITWPFWSDGGVNEFCDRLGIPAEGNS